MNKKQIKKIKEICSADTKKVYLLSGPTYSNALPHLGTLSNLTIKDCINRFFTKFHNKNYKLILGFDNHGIPISNNILRKKKSKDVLYNEMFDVIKFRQECREFAIKQSNNIINFFKKFHINFDVEKYFTCSLKYIKSNIQVLKRIFQNNYLKHKIKPIYWCCSCKTFLSLAEIEDQNICIDSIFMTVKLNIKLNQDIYLIIFTTTPWTIPFNQAIMYNSKLKYVKINKDNKLFISSFSFINSKIKVIQDFIKTAKITSINNINDFFNKLYNNDIFTYHDILPNFDFINKNCKLTKNILVDSIKVKNLGSGFVHLATDFGIDDFEVISKLNLIYNPKTKKKFFICNDYIDKNYVILKFSRINFKPSFNFNDNNLMFYKNQFFSIKDLNNIILKKIEENRQLISFLKYNTTSAFCWRCKNKLIIRSSKQWFIDISDKKFFSDIFKKKIQNEYIKSCMLSMMNNENCNKLKINFNSLYSTIKKRQSWCISRQRPWGTILPSFICSNCQKIFISSESCDFFLKIQKYSELDIFLSSSWKYFKQNKQRLKYYSIVCIYCKNKTSYLHGETIDIWFDSGITWFYFQKHILKTSKSVNLYIEGYDQFRGWFQSSALTYFLYFDKEIKKLLLINQKDIKKYLNQIDNSEVNKKIKEINKIIQLCFPYRNILCHGYVINNKREKLSKSKNNYKKIDFTKFTYEIFRLFILSSKFTNEIKFNDQILKIYKKRIIFIKNFITKIFNIIENFFQTISKKDKVIFSYLITQLKINIQNKEIFVNFYQNNNKDKFNAENFHYINKKKYLFYEFEIMYLQLKWFSFMFIYYFKSTNVFKFFHFFNILVKQINRYLIKKFFNNVFLIFYLSVFLFILLNILETILPSTSSLFLNKNFFKKYFKDINILNYYFILIKKKFINFDQQLQLIKPLYYLPIMYVINKFYDQSIIPLFNLYSNKSYKIFKLLIIKFFYSEIEKQFLNKNYTHINNKYINMNLEFKLYRSFLKKINVNFNKKKNNFIFHKINKNKISEIIIFNFYNNLKKNFSYEQLINKIIKQEVLQRQYLFKTEKFNIIDVHFK